MLLPYSGTYYYYSNFLTFWLCIFFFIRCQCNGHASSCKKNDGEDGMEKYNTTMICECEHGTAGPNCETCLDDHWDQPWQRATMKDANECKRKSPFSSSYSFFFFTPPLRCIPSQVILWLSGRVGSGHTGVHEARACHHHRALRE